MSAGEIPEGAQEIGRQLAEQLRARSPLQPMQLAVHVRHAFQGRRAYPASSMLVLMMEEAITNHFRRASIYSGVVKST